MSALWYRHREPADVQSPTFSFIFVMGISFGGIILISILFSGLVGVLRAGVGWGAREWAMGTLRVLVYRSVTRAFKGCLTVNRRRTTTPHLVNLQKRSIPSKEVLKVNIC